MGGRRGFAGVPAQDGRATEARMVQRDFDMRSDTRASLDDIKRVFGALDQAKLLDILALRPSILDLENALMSLSGDRDVFGTGEALPSTAGEIAAIVTADEDEESARAH
jgi:hypothetical protein